MNLQTKMLVGLVLIWLVAYVKSQVLGWEKGAEKGGADEQRGRNFFSNANEQRS